MGVDFGDLNGDGWPDIYVSNITQEYGLKRVISSSSARDTPSL